VVAAPPAASPPPASAPVASPSLFRSDESLQAFGGEEEWSQPRRRTQMLIAIGAVVGIGAGVLVWKALSKDPAPPPAPAAEVAAPAPPPVAPPAPAPAPAAPVAAAPVAAPPVELPGSAAAPSAAAVPPPAPAAAAAAPAEEDPLLEACKKAYAGSKYKAITDACGKALQAKPNAADVMVMMAHAELDRGNMPKALEWSKKALAVDGNLAEAYVFVGTVEQEQGKPAQAKAAYERYLELAPTGKYAEEIKTILGTLK
jgi:tetratricopeptide (TPR) repeat protein